MTLLNNLFTLSDGIIIEPSEPDNIGYWEFLFNGHATSAYPGFIIFVVALAAGTLIAVCLREWSPFVVVTLFGCIFAVTGLIVAAVQLLEERNNFTGYDAEVVAERLSEYYKMNINADEVSESGLITALASGDEVSKLEYFSDTDRDPKTGEWVNSTKFFMVDGKVVEIYIESEPLKGDFVTPN